MSLEPGHGHACLRQFSRDYVDAIAEFDPHANDLAPKLLDVALKLVA